MNPTAADLDVADKARLVSGHTTWSTSPIEERGVPAVTLADGPHGVRAQGPAVDGDNLGLTASAPATCFPPAVAVGSSWDPAVAARMATAIGVEARALGVDVLLGPGVNIKRSPLCGRNFEYYSEDPLLAGMLGAAFVTAVQATGVGSSVKHFAANNQETDRMRVDAVVDERTLREIYFPAFERIITQARPATVMCSYNKVNGTYASQNSWLLTQVLRSEWGFDGLVVSDWGAVHDPVAAVRAGLDLEMPETDGRSAAAIVAAVESGELSEGLLDLCVDRVLGLRAWHATPTAPPDFDEHHEIARDTATQCAVLLKNAGVLPLSNNQRVAVIGEFARSPRYQGGGSSHVNATRVDSFLDAAGVLVRADLVFEPGFVLGPPAPQDDVVALRAAAVAAAASSDVAVVFAGLSETEESEGFDRTSLSLPATQIDVIKAVAAAAPRTVVVLSHGGVVTMEEWHDDVDAILDGFLLGQGGGSATADLLFGKANPSGRLSETIPRRLFDHPSNVNFPGERRNVVYGERLLVGYRAFTTLEMPTRYPFGHGLSYTTFDLSDFDVTVIGSDTAAVRVTVTNSGSREGSYVVQVYVGAQKRGDVMRPRRELRAFAKVHLRAGEATTVSLELDRRAFAYWDVDLDDWVVEEGSYAIELCEDSEKVIAAEDVRLIGDQRVRPLTLWNTLQEWLDHPVIGPVLLDELDSDKLRYIAQPHILRMIGSLTMRSIADAMSGKVASGTFEALIERSQPS